VVERERRLAVCNKYMRDANQWGDIEGVSMSKFVKLLAALFLVAGALALTPGAAFAQHHGHGGGFHRGFGPGFGFGLRVGYPYYGGPYRL
jgi:hypothetical protein